MQNPASSIIVQNPALSALVQNLALTTIVQNLALGSDDERIMTEVGRGSSEYGQWLAPNIWAPMSIRLQKVKASSRTRH